MFLRDYGGGDGGGSRSNQHRHYHLDTPRALLVMHLSGLCICDNMLSSHLYGQQVPPRARGRCICATDGKKTGSKGTKSSLPFCYKLVLNFFSD